MSYISIINEQEQDITVICNLEEERLIDFQMYLDHKSSTDKLEFMIPIKYDEVVLLRDYLTSVINLYKEKKDGTR